MNRLFIFVSVVIALSVPVGVARAAPFASDRAKDSLIVLAADGCWLGWHRNRSGGCSRDRYGLLGYGIDYVPGPYYPTGPTVCGGRGVYQICNIFGYCWWVCN